MTWGGSRLTRKESDTPTRGIIIVIENHKFSHFIGKIIPEYLNLGTLCWTITIQYRIPSVLVLEYFSTIHA